MKIKAFTLIELLVVMVIIGILGSISFSTYNGVIDRAREAKALNFAQNIDRHLYTNFDESYVGMWNMEEKNGERTLVDASEHQNPLGLDVAAVWDNDTPLGIGNSIKCPGGGAIRCLSSNGVLSLNNRGELLNDDNKNWTISTWVKLEEYPAAWSNLFYLQGQVALAANPRLLMRNDGRSHAQSSPATIYITSENGIKLNKWHHIVFTTNTTQSQYYLDGTLVGTDTSIIPVDINSPHVYFGGRTPGLKIWRPRIFKSNIDFNEFY